MCPVISQQGPPRAETHHQSREARPSFTFKVDPEPTCQSSNNFALGPPQLLQEPLMRKRKIFYILPLIGCHPRLGKKVVLSPWAHLNKPPIREAAERTFSAQPHPRAQPSQGRKCHSKNYCYCHKQTLFQ